MVIWPTVAQISGPKCWTDDWPSIRSAETAPSWTILPACLSLSQLESSLIATAVCLKWLEYATVICDIVLYIMFQSNRPLGSVAGNSSMLWCLYSVGPLACIQICKYSSCVVPLEKLGPSTQCPLYYSTLSSKQRWLLCTVLAILEQLSQGWNQGVWCETDPSAYQPSVLNWPTDTFSKWAKCHKCRCLVAPGICLKNSMKSIGYLYYLSPVFYENSPLPLVKSVHHSSLTWPGQTTGLLNWPWNKQWFGSSKYGSSVRVFLDLWSQCIA